MIWSFVAFQLFRKDWQGQRKIEAYLERTLLIFSH